MRMNTRSGFAVGALTLMSLLGACASRDEELRGRVDAILAADDSVGAIRFRLDNDRGTVTLAGTVTDQAYRRRAVALVRTTTGVTDVIDRIVVVPPTVSVDSTLGPGLGRRATTRMRPGHM